jgi:hypothetical protein
MPLSLVLAFAVSVFVANTAVRLSRERASASPYTLTCPRVQESARALPPVRCAHKVCRSSSASLALLPSIARACFTSLEASAMRP